MTIQETLNLLVKCSNEDYLGYRMQIDDKFMEFIKDILPSDFEYIQEKEEAYQKSKGLLNELFKKKDGNQSL